MIKCCANPNCYADDGEACSLGEMNIVDCVHWDSKKPSKERQSLGLESITSARVPWSGNSLGLSDLLNLALRRKPTIIGLLGAHDAGKTTLLIGSYLQLLHGLSFPTAAFAGSYSLEAWESLAAWVRRDDAARSPTFPPHTPRGTSRVPGLLHFGLRNNVTEYRDVLFTDAPGEWFTRWAVQEDAPGTEGAQWTVLHTDVFLIFADCQRLSGAERGSARNELRQLIERLGNHVISRPTILIWAKFDTPPSEGIRTAIRRTLNEKIPHAIEYETSTEQPESFLRVLNKAINMGWAPNYAQPIDEKNLKQNPFDSFRGHYVHA